MGADIPEAEERERLTLRKASELFLIRLELERRRSQRNRQARERYHAADDFAKSIDEAYRVIRERMANGGPGWTPP